MQRNSTGAARDGGPVVLRPVRATPCIVRGSFLNFYANSECWMLFSRVLP